ncbi:hypothetical protein [Acinetobacter baumannii]|uniref:hypothetical protein n=1 Tax=Acinetobacter baumannii TaxID=470 RepID=UPI00389217AA
MFVQVKRHFNLRISLLKCPTWMRMGVQVSVDFAVQGQSIDLAEVKNLFSQNIGKKPSLKITILKSTALYEFENYCWVQYQEHQQTSETETVRTSTACIKVEDEKCYWVYLHETLVPSSS